MSRTAARCRSTSSGLSADPTSTASACWRVTTTIVFARPNLFLLQETFEYVLWGPIGAFAEAEQGRVSLIDDSLTKGDLKNTYGLGLTVRAGGLPLISFWWAQGGPEGHHIALTMNANLLGGSSRPSLH